MTEDDLRALVRQAVSRHLTAAGTESGPGGPQRPGTPAPGACPSFGPSFGRYLLPRDPGDGGACLIEPAVKCNHCGFCQSHGF